VFGNITFGYAPFGGPNLEESSSAPELSLISSGEIVCKFALIWACEISISCESSASKSIFSQASVFLDAEVLAQVSRQRLVLSEIRLLTSISSAFQRGRPLSGVCSAGLFVEGTTTGPIYLSGSILISFEGSAQVIRNRLAATTIHSELGIQSSLIRTRSLVGEIALHLEALLTMIRGVRFASGVGIEAELGSVLTKGTSLSSSLLLEIILDSAVSRLRLPQVDMELGLATVGVLQGRFSLAGSVAVSLDVLSEVKKTKPLASQCGLGLGVTVSTSRMRALGTSFQVSLVLDGTVVKLVLAAGGLELIASISAQTGRHRGLLGILEISISTESHSIQRLLLAASLYTSASLHSFIGRSKPLRARFTLSLSGLAWSSRKRVQRALSLVSITSRATLVGTPRLPVIWEPRLIVRGIDLSHRVRSLTLSFAFDAGAWTLDLELTNYAQLVEAGEGLDPFDPISKYNTDGPLLGSYSPVTLELRNPETGYVFRAFTGFVGPLDRTSSEAWGEAGTVSVSCVGPSQPLKDYFIPEWEALRYTQAVISREGRPDLLNRILMDQGFEPVIEYLDDPYYHVTEYIVGGVSLWEALENALAPTGFRLIEWPSATEGLKIVVKDPIRSKTDPDRILKGGYRSRRISGSESDVRTWVAVVYRDRNDFQEKIVWAEAEPEIVEKFGIPDGKGGRKHRRMVYKTTERSLVDSESEARELAATILWDLQYPTPSFELEIPWFDPDFRPFQLIEVIGEQITTTFGVMEIEWEWSFDNPYGTTRLRGSTGMVIGAKGLWFVKDSKKELARLRNELDRLTNEACPRPDAPEAYGAWFVQPDGTANPVIDVYIPDIPPFWAQGIRLYIWRFRRIEEAKVGSFGTNWVSPQGKTYTDYRFGASYRDYIVFTSGEAKARGCKIITTLSNRVLTASNLPSELAVGDGFWIVRLKDIEVREIGLTNYYRISGVRAGEAVAVSIAWIPRVAR